MAEDGYDAVWLDTGSDGFLARRMRQGLTDGCELGCANGWLDGGGDG